MIFLEKADPNPFDENSAWALIETKITWDENLFSKNKEIIIFDEAALDSANYNYFISTHSNYLPICCNKGITLELYSLHHFTRQLGFC